MAKKPTPVEPESCGSCRFFQPNDHDDAGYCRRFPPVPVVIETSLSVAQATSSAEEWCGEFSRKLQS